MVYLGRFCSKLLQNFIAIRSPAMSKLNKTSKNGGNLRRSSFSDTPRNPVAGRFEVLSVPIKSDSDKKEYKVIRLPNLLTACLISDKSPIEEDEEESEEESDDDHDSEDPESIDSDDSQGSEADDGVSHKMAAAGLCVGVGSFSDPKDVPGMAHFLEHMVFMGSKKFPSENDFDAFIKKGGGSDNASTDAETTVFYFECLEKHLEKGLDKFAQFFISPLMKKEAMTRERDAIESEFQMSLQSDSSRKEQLLCCLAQEDSPVNSFPWGNLITLRDNITDVELYAGVHDFRNRHYSAHRMTLAIQARLPIDVLEKYVLDCFTDVPNNQLPPIDFSNFTYKIFDTPKFQRLYYVKPVKDQQQVTLTWSLPSLLYKFRSKPHQYVAHLLGDEGPGSLLSYLKKKVWAISSTAGNNETGMEHNSIYMLFTATIDLTDQGLAHVDQVIEAVFSYINMLKRIGPQRRIYDELKTVADTSFKFAVEETAVDFVEDLCEAMQIYPPADYIAGSELYYEYDPDSIEQVLQMLTPSKMNLMVVSEKLPQGLKFDKVEQWFGTKYTDIDVPADWIRKWENVEPYPELNVPPPNPYLTTDFEILKPSENYPKYPEKISESDLYELWYRQDQKFNLPIAYYYIYLISPKSIESAESAAMTDMMLNLIVYNITEELYPALAAELTFSITTYEGNLMIKVYGYNEKLPLILTSISDHLTTFGDCVTGEEFSAIKDKLLKVYYNKLLKPSALAKDVRLNLLVHPFWSPIDRYTKLKSVSYEDVKNFSKEFFKTLYVKALVQGNVTRSVASETIQKFLQNLQVTVLSQERHPRFKVVEVPLGEKCCRVEGLNLKDTNSIVTNYYQASSFSLKDSVIIELIMMLIEEPLFDILRTKEQLGYHVYCTLRNTFGILGYTVTVNSQATKHTTKHVDERIEEFLKHSIGLLEKIKGDELDTIKEDLIKTKLCEDVDLKEEVDRNWTEIVDNDYVFDRIAREVELIRKVRSKEVVEWWRKHNKFGKKENFRKLSIQVQGYHTTEDKNLDKSEGTGNALGDSSDRDSFSLRLITSLNGIEKNGKDYYIDDVTLFKSNMKSIPSQHAK